MDTSVYIAARYLTGLPPLVTSASSMLGASAGMALPAAYLWPVHSPGITAWLALLLVGVLCTGLAYILFFRLIAHAGPQRALLKLGRHHSQTGTP